MNDSVGMNREASIDDVLDEIEHARRAASGEQSSAERITVRAIRVAPARQLAQDGEAR
jgi:hypothetical protein